MNQLLQPSKNLSQNSSLVKQLSFGERAKLTNNSTLKRLFQIIESKQTNVALAADVTTKETLLKIADELGPYICILKTHIDIITDFDEDLLVQLMALAKKHTFLIFEDRKFADIGNTVALQYEKGIYHIADWADIINAHILPGPGIIEGLQKIGLPKKRGLLLLPHMSSKGSFISEKYSSACITLADEFKEFIIGFLIREKIAKDPKYIYMTTGVQLEKGGDNVGQQYLTPEIAIQELESDVIIVGRGIYQSKNCKAAALAFKQTAWQAYQQRLKSGF